jgi:hypothetical protein
LAFTQRGEGKSVDLGWRLRLRHSLEGIRLRGVVGGWGLDGVTPATGGSVGG